jgi:NAD(P)-dependent dehydrogenase (short-subunit alcohol dehydrogenase family)
MAGRRAVVTGAASGIGAAVARRLVRDGLEVLAIDRAVPAVEGATPLVADLADADARASVVAAGEGFDCQQLGPRLEPGGAIVVAGRVRGPDSVSALAGGGLHDGTGNQLLRWVGDVVRDRKDER